MDADNDGVGDLLWQSPDGKVGGWDADQKPFIYVVRGGKFTLFEGK